MPIGAGPNLTGPVFSAAKLPKRSFWRARVHLSARVPSLYPLAERVEAMAGLDRAAKALQGAINAAQSTSVKNVLNGDWLGHPVHPLLTDVPIGFWTSAAVLDVIGGKGGRKSADRLLGLGILAAVPTAATGAANWADFNEAKSRRVGVVHAAANTVALLCQVASYRNRRRGRRLRAKAWSAGGLGALTMGGFLGGHLAYGQGLGVERTAWDDRPEGWVDAVAFDSLVEGTPVAARVGEVDVVVVRSAGGTVRALTNRCNHMGGPLSEGEVADGCITCPWHASTFRLDDGSVVRTPAVARQASWDTRVLDGMVQVSAR